MTNAIHATLLLASLVGRWSVMRKLPEVVELAQDDVPRKSYQEVIDWIRGKLMMTRDMFNDLSDTLKTRAFTIARETELTIIESAQESLQSAIEKGETYDTWRDEVVKDGGTFISDAHAETVYRTNVFSGYAAEQKSIAEHPQVADQVWGYAYHTLEDDRVRPSHAAMNGVTKPKSWSGWSTWYPPNGYNCRCFVDVITKFEAEKLGIKSTKGPPRTVRDVDGNIVDVKPDKDFEAAPDTT